MRVIVLPGGVIRELVPAVDWEYGFRRRDLRRIGRTREESGWTITVFGLRLSRYTYSRHGVRLDEVPEGAEITYPPNLRLSDLQAAGLTVRFVPR